MIQYNVRRHFLLQHAENIDGDPELLSFQQLSWDSYVVMHTPNRGQKGFLSAQFRYQHWRMAVQISFVTWMIRHSLGAGLVGMKHVPMGRKIYAKYIHHELYIAMG